MLWIDVSNAHVANELTKGIKCNGNPLLCNASQSRDSCPEHCCMCSCSRWLQSAYISWRVEQRILCALVWMKLIQYCLYGVSYSILKVRGWICYQNRHWTYVHGKLMSSKIIVLFSFSAWDMFLAYKKTLRINMQQVIVIFYFYFVSIQKLLF